MAEIVWTICRQFIQESSFWNKQLHTVQPT